MRGKDAFSDFKVFNKAEQLRATADVIASGACAGDGGPAGVQRRFLMSCWPEETEIKDGVGRQASCQHRVAHDVAVKITHDHI